MNEDFFDPVLFPANFVRKLTPLRFLVKRKSGVVGTGNSSALQVTGNVEFHGYRPYSPGDDLRYLDWNVYGRSGQMVLKQFLGEESFHFFILLDASASMKIGVPTKMASVLRTAAGFSYLAMRSGHSVCIALSFENHVEYSPVFFSERQIYRLFHFLSWKEAKGKNGLEKALGEAMRVRPKSSIMVCSDLLRAQSAKEGLRRLIGRGHEVSLFHLMAEEEIGVPEMGPVCLKDMETGEKCPFLLDKDGIKEYADFLCEFREEWRAFCLRHRIHYIFATNRVPLEQAIFQGIKIAGWIA